mgnify:CR=1 FL=1
MAEKTAFWIAKTATIGMIINTYRRGKGCVEMACKKIDRLFITGPTGTNVMDIQIVVINR